MSATPAAIETAPARRGAPDAAIFVGVVWTALLVFAVVFVARFASPIPFADDLSIAPYLTGELPPTPSELWALHNEHRVPFPKLILIGLTRLTRDIRSGMYFEIALLAATSLAAILIARRARGRVEYTDAFFPLIWLSWGNPENLLMAFQLTVVIPAVLSCFALLVAAADPRPPGPRLAIALGLTALVMPLCSASGVPLAFPVVVWLALAGVAARREGGAGSRSRSVLLFVGAAAGLTTITLFFLGFEPRPDAATEHGQGMQIAVVGSDFLGLALGAGGGMIAPYSNWFVIVVGLVSLVALVLVLGPQPSERLRALGILGAIAGVVGVAASIGWGRGSDPTAGFAIRYVTLPAPLLSAAYLTWCLYGAPGARRLVQNLMFAVACAVLALNVQQGVFYGVIRSLQSESILRDIEAGLTLEQVAYAHPELLSDPPARAALLDVLRRTGFPPFDVISATPAGLEGEAQGPEVASDDPRPYGMFRTRPLSASADAGPVARKAYGMQTLMVFGASEIRFALPSEASILSGRYGMHPQAFGETRSDGLLLEAVIEEEGYPPTTIFSRFLDPGRRIGDRGPFELRVGIPPHSDGELVLRTLNPEDRGIEMDWAFWTEIAIQ